MLNLVKNLIRGTLNELHSISADRGKPETLRVNTIHGVNVSGFWTRLGVNRVKP